MDTLAFSPDGRSLLSANDEGTVRSWDLASGVQSTLRGGAFESGLGPVPGGVFAFAPDGRWLASGQYQDVVLSEVASRRSTRLQGHRWHVHQVVFASDGRSFASASDDGTVRLWEVEGARQLAVLGDRANGPVRAVAFSPAGDLVAGASEDGTVRFWDPVHGTQLLVVRFGATVTALAVSDHGVVVALGRGIAYLEFVEVTAEAESHD